MLSIKDISDWFDEVIEQEEYDLTKCYSLFFNQKEQKLLCVTNSPSQLTLDETIGQKQTYRTLDVILLVHYNKSYYDTLDISDKIYEYLLDLTYSRDNFQIGENTIYFVKLLSDNRDIGQDDNKIFERVINLRFYYE